MRVEQVNEVRKWRLLRWAYYGVLMAAFGGVASLGANWIVFGRLTPLNKADFAEEVREECMPVVQAIKRFRAEQGRLPGKLDELVPGYLKEVPKYDYFSKDEYSHYSLRRHRGTHMIRCRITDAGEEWSISGSYVGGDLSVEAIPATTTRGPE